MHASSESESEVQTSSGVYEWPSDVGLTGALDGDSDGVSVGVCDGVGGSGSSIQ